ncbi:MAG: alcohol dehydrogenase catalytic domain-containing protein, partial [Micrococcaceae bacterium]|nr:alcohol dehydrogenase catalytic domain-containing protein [Micrococcaceae bacterium]
MSTMNAAIVHEFGNDIDITTAEVPEPGPGQALVKLIASGVCHTDLHALGGDWPVQPKLPL